MEFSNYTVYTKHDMGTVRICVPATSYQNAIDKVMAAEGCPERSITQIKRKDANRKKSRNS